MGRSGRYDGSRGEDRGREDGEDDGGAHFDSVIKMEEKMKLSKRVEVFLGK